MPKYLASVLTLIYFLSGSTVQGQDYMRDHRIRGLKGLKDVALVMRPNVKWEIMTFKEISDTFELKLKQQFPELQVKRVIEGSKDLLELSYITHSNGGFVEISLYRWVSVIATGEDVYAKVWDDKVVCPSRIERTDLRESIETLLVSFGADFIRANQKGGKNRIPK